MNRHKNIRLALFCFLVSSSQLIKLVTRHKHWTMSFSVCSDLSLIWSYSEIGTTVVTLFLIKLNWFCSCNEGVCNNISYVFEQCYIRL